MMISSRSIQTMAVAGVIAGIPDGITDAGMDAAHRAVPHADLQHPVRGLRNGTITTARGRVHLKRIRIGAVGNGRVSRLEAIDRSAVGNAGPVTAGSVLLGEHD